MKISKVYKVASNPGTIFMLICAILSLTFTTPAMGAIGNGNGRDATIDRPSGDELFKAIFLMEGDLVNQIPSLQKFRSDMGEVRGSKATNTVYADMKESHPGYFGELESAVNSQNHHEIEATVEKGAELIILTQYSRYLLSQNNENAPDISGLNLEKSADRTKAVEQVRDFLGTEYGAEFRQACGAWFAFAFAVALAVAWVAIWVAVYAEVEVASASPGTQDIVAMLREGTVSKDRIIADLANLK